MLIASEGPGKGCEFTVRLPCVVEAANDRGTVKAVSPTYEAKKILVVDDNEDAARMLSILFAKGGNRVEIAHEGHAAVKLAQSLRPDLIVLDLGMPGMDGLGWLEQSVLNPGVSRRCWSR